MTRVGRAERAETGRRGMATNQRDTRRAAESPRHEEWAKLRAESAVLRARSRDLIAKSRALQMRIQKKLPQPANR